MSYFQGLSTDFLQFTLTNPNGIAAPFSFSIDEHTDVWIWDTGVIQFEPRINFTESVENIVLSSGIHGNETAPIELCNQLITQLLTGQLITKQRLLFIFGNPPAINQASRFIEENLNRLFSGAHAAGKGRINAERIRANNLEQYVSAFFAKGDPAAPRCHYDLHTAIRKSKHEKFAIYPYLHGKAYNGKQLMFLVACGVNAVLLHHEATTTFSYYSSYQHQAHGFTIELGQVKSMGNNDMSRFIAIKEMLIKLISGKNLKLMPFDAAKLHLYQVSRSINKHVDDFRFTFSSDVENFTTFPKGYVLAKEGGQEIKVTEQAESIVFPNANVPVGQRAVLCLVPAIQYRIE